MTTRQPVEVAANLCRVVQDGDDVVIHFGQVQASGAAPGAAQAVALCRIGMSGAGAARLQDLLVDLLRQPPPGGTPPR